MKYSLRDFRRAADRHVGSMDISPACRNQLTRPSRQKKHTPLAFAGWAAAVAACIIVMALLLPPMRPAPPPVMPSNSLPPVSGSAPESPPAAPPVSDRCAEYSSLLMRNDMHEVHVDYMGQPYYFNAAFAGAEYMQYGVIYTEAAGADFEDTLDSFYAENCLSAEEVKHSAAGRQYYGDKVDSPDLYIQPAMWPRPDRITYLPDAAGASWAVYYSELDVGLLYRETPEEYKTKWALGNKNGLVTDFIYNDIFGFTRDGRSFASVDSETMPDNIGIDKYGPIDAAGNWLEAPLTSSVDIYYYSPEYESDASPAIYIVQKVMRALPAYAPEDVWPERECIYIRDMSGHRLLAAGDVNTMLNVIAPDSLIPYSDIDTGLWGYFDASINVVIPPSYDYAKEFSAGLAAVELKDRFGFIDAKGNMVIEPQYIYVTKPFLECDGTAQVIVRTSENDFETRIINRSGQDVTSYFSIVIQHISSWLDKTALCFHDSKMIYWALSCFILSLMAFKKDKSAFVKLCIPLEAYAAFTLMYASLVSDAHTALPASAIFGGLPPELAAYSHSAFGIALLLISAAYAGMVCARAARSYIKHAVFRIITCAALCILPFAVRGAINAFTAVDMDVMLCFAAGAGLGSLTMRRKAVMLPDPTVWPLSHASRFACLLTALLIGILPVYFSCHDWAPKLIMSEPDFSISAVDSGVNAAIMREAALAQYTYMQHKYGENWLEQFDAMLKNPEGYSVLEISCEAKNISLADKSAAIYPSFRRRDDAAPDGHDCAKDVSSISSSDVLTVPRRGSAVLKCRILIHNGALDMHDWLSEALRTYDVTLY